MEEQGLSPGVGIRKGGGEGKWVALFELHIVETVQTVILILLFLPPSSLPLLPLSRWASKGLNFLNLAVPPRQLATISRKEFESLQKLMADCLNHVIGEATAPQQSYKGEDALSSLSKLTHIYCTFY